MRGLAEGGVLGMITGLFIFVMVGVVLGGNEPDKQQLEAKEECYASCLSQDLHVGYFAFGSDSSDGSLKCICTKAQVPND